MDCERCGNCSYLDDNPLFLPYCTLGENDTPLEEIRVCPLAIELPDSFVIAYRLGLEVK